MSVLKSAAHLFYTSLFLVSAGSFADVPTTPSQIHHLAQQRVWLKLIEATHGKPEIISDGFYLSDRQHFNAENELIATIQLLNQYPEKFCDMPARAFWLQQQGVIPAIEKDCKDIPNPTDNLSWIQVSSYLGNPASTFGHVLIRKNDDDATENLTETSYNFGAKVPPHENPYVYAFKGVFGGYRSFFATADYFKQDAAYSKNEQRDMWEYVLDLTPEQRKLINYHLYELQNKAFRYYFIKQNCGYRVASLLELIYPEQITHRISPWYAPDSVFHFINEHQQQIPLQKMHYVPSEQKAVYAQYHQLSAVIKQRVDQSIKDQSIANLSDLTETEQIRYLDFMLDFLNYQMHTQKDATSYPALRKQIVQARIQQPVGTSDHAEPLPTVPSTATGPRPSNVMLGWSSDDHATANLSLFHHDALNIGSDLGTTFKAVDLHFNINDQHASLDHAELIHIEQLENMYDKPYGERHISWRFNLGYDRPQQQDGRYFTEGGLGAAWSTSPQWLAYGFAGANANTDALIPIPKLSTGLLYKFNRVGLRLESSYSYDFNKRKDDWQNSLTTHVALSKNIYLELETQKHQQQVGLSWSW